MGKEKSSLTNAGLQARTIAGDLHDYKSFSEIAENWAKIDTRPA